MFIGDRMVTKLQVVRPEEPIFTARQLMKEKGIRHLPVVDREGRLVGIVTDRDMRTAMPSQLLSKEEFLLAKERISNHTVADIMTPDPLTIREYHTLQDALLVMNLKKVGAFPVVSESGELKGIISTRDILKAFIDMLNIEEPGSLLCIVVEEKPGQMKKVVDIISEENISLGSILVARYWDNQHRAIFPYLLTYNVARVKEKLIERGFRLIDPIEVFLKKDQLFEKK